MPSAGHRRSAISLFDAPVARSATISRLRVESGSTSASAGGPRARPLPAVLPRAPPFLPGGEQPLRRHRTARHAALPLPPHRAHASSPLPRPARSSPPSRARRAYHGARRRHHAARRRRRQATTAASGGSLAPRSSVDAKWERRCLSCTGDVSRAGVGYRPVLGYMPAATSLRPTSSPTGSSSTTVIRTSSGSCRGGLAYSTFRNAARVLESGQYAFRVQWETTAGGGGWREPTWFRKDVLVPFAIGARYRSGPDDMTSPSSRSPTRCRRAGGCGRM